MKVIVGRAAEMAHLGDMQQQHAPSRLTTLDDTVAEREPVTESWFDAVTCRAGQDQRDWQTYQTAGWLVRGYG